MRIIERYPLYQRIAGAEGWWRLLAPITGLLSKVYTSFAGSRRRRPGPAGARHGSGPGRAGAGHAREAPERARLISVGNLEVGGTGKTPVTIELASRLAGRGCVVAVVTRGYRSVAERSRCPVVLMPEGAEPVAESGDWIDASTLAMGKGTGRSPARMVDVAGDEAVLYSSRGIPVVIDRDRKRGVNTAAAALSPTHIFLDDAYFRKDVQADLSILLLDAEMPFGNGRLLPAGTLREDRSSASMADVVIFTRAAPGGLRAGPPEEVRGKDIYISRHRPAGLFDRGGPMIESRALVGRDQVLFSGIGRPESFERAAVTAGLAPFLSVRFADHHRYSRADVDLLLENADGDTVFVTTEKDMGKVKDLFPPKVLLLELRVSIEIDDVERLVERII